MTPTPPPRLSEGLDPPLQCRSKKVSQTHQDLEKDLCSFFLALSRWRESRELKQRRRQRQRERQKKAIGLDWQNNSPARESRCCVSSLPSEKPNFTSFGGGELKTTPLSFSFPELLFSLLELNSGENCQHLIN